MTFDEPVELKCVLDVGQALKRFVPILIAAGCLAWLVAAVTLGVMQPKVPAVSFIGGCVAAVAVPYLMYTRKRAKLEQQYGDHQRLTLSASGLQRRDHAVVLEMPWRGIDRIETHNSALRPRPAGVSGGPLNVAANAAIAGASTAVAEGIIGKGRMRPVPDAPHAVLVAHDRNYGSKLRSGQEHYSKNAVIFPAEFESDWANGTIGAWLRHYRPDIDLSPR